MKSNELKIEGMIDIFSGRPNPKWPLSNEQVDELKKKLSKLPMSKPVMPPGLGYRGVLVTNLSRDGRIPDQIKVYNSILSIADTGRTSYYEDVNNIEEWLLEQARKLGYGDAIKKFREWSHK